MSSTHHHTHESANFDRAFAIGIALNLGFVGIESFYGWHINSLALLADAGHNLSDVAGLVLAWAGRLSPNPRHTYGWQRSSILAAFTNAMLLLLAMGALAWEAVGRLASPAADAASQGVTMMAVAGVDMVVNTATAWLFMRGSKTDLNIRGAFIHMAADALVSAGVVVAGTLTLWMGWAWLDAVVSLAIAGVILIGTWGLFKQSLHLLMDGVPDSVDPQAVHDCLAALPGVSQVQQLHIWATSTSRMALTAHLVMPQGHADDAFLQNATKLLHDQFDITQVTQVTLQVLQAPQQVEQ